MKILKKMYTDQIYAILRFVTGFLFFWHGTNKVFGIPDAHTKEMPFHIMYIAGPIELIGGFFIAIGLFTRSSAFLSSGLMAVAYFMAHGTRAILPIQNRGELAVVYCILFLFISSYGSGIWSIDSWRKNLKIESTKN